MMVQCQNNAIDIDSTRLEKHLFWMKLRWWQNGLNGAMWGSRLMLCFCRVIFFFAILHELMRIKCLEDNGTRSAAQILSQKWILRHREVCERKLLVMAADTGSKQQFNWFWSAFGCRQLEWSDILMNRISVNILIECWTFENGCRRESQILSIQAHQCMPAQHVLLSEIENVGSDQSPLLYEHLPRYLIQTYWRLFIVVNFSIQTILFHFGIFYFSLALAVDFPYISLQLYALEVHLVRCEKCTPSENRNKKRNKVNGTK